MLREPLIGLGDFALFSARALGGLTGLRGGGRETLAVFHEVGVGSVPVIATTGAFIGMVLALQAYHQFHPMGFDTLIGGVTSATILSELGPVLAAVMIAGRVGSAFASQIAAMKTNEQIDALTMLGRDPVARLASPRLLACLVLTPLLTVIADAAGILGASAIAVWGFGIEGHSYWENTLHAAGHWHLFTGLLKSMFFGGAIALICCHKGFRAGPGAEGVGRAATGGFVYSFVAILVLDFFLVYALNGLRNYFRDFGGAS